MKLEPSILINALLTALALGTTVLVVVTEDEPTTDQLEERARNLLPSFPRSAFRSLALNAGAKSWLVTAESAPESEHPRYVFRDDGQAADADAVDGMLRTLELAGYVRRLTPAEEDRTALGLDKPTATLAVEFTNARFELRFGKDALTPAGTSYLEVVGTSADPAVYLVRSELRRDVVVARDALRPKAIVPFAFNDVTALRWQEGADTIEVRRLSGVEYTDAWNRRVRRDSVDRLGLELAHAKAVRFVAASAAEKAISGDAFALTVTLTPTKKAEQLSFRVGGTCPDDPALEALIRTAPTTSAECVAPGLRRLFRETAASLRDDRPFALHTDEVESMRIERKNSALELTRAEKGFHMLAPATQDIGLDAGNSRLDELVRATGERIERPELPALGLEPPEGTVRLRSSVVEGAPRFEELVQIGRARPDGRLPVRRSKDGVVLLLSAEAAAAYAVDSSLLKSRHVFDFNLSDLASLTIATGGERQRLRHVEDSFELVEPKGFEHDGEHVLDLVQALATLTADRWVAEKAEARHGLSEPQAVLTVELAGADEKPRVITLTVGADTAGGAFGSVDIQPGVFVLPRPFVTQVTTLILSRAVFQADPAELSAIDLERARETVRLRRQGDAFASESSLSPAAIDRVTRALSNLRPEAALHTGPARSNEGFDSPVLVLRLVPTDTTRKPKRIQIGSADSYRSEKIFHARVDGIDATYALPARAVRELMDAFGG